MRYFCEMTGQAFPTVRPRCRNCSLCALDSFLSLATVEVPWNCENKSQSSRRDEEDLTNRSNSNIVDCQSPNSESTSKRRDGRIGTSEHAVSTERFAFLSFRFALNVSESFGDEVLGGRFLALELELEQLGLVLKPLRDLLSSELELSFSVGDVEDLARELGADFSCGTHHSLSRSAIRRVSEAKVVDEGR